jgi:hypothetical protein
MNNHENVYSHGLRKNGEHSRETNLAGLYGVLMDHLVDFMII